MPIDEARFVHTINHLTQISNHNASAINQNAGYVLAAGYAIVEILKELRSVPEFDSSRIEGLLEEVSKGNEPGVKTGDPKIDRQFRGGLQLMCDGLAEES